MNWRGAALFGVVALLFGVPYLFVAEALEGGFGPVATAAGRTVIGALVLLVFTHRAAWRLITVDPVRIVILAVVEVVLPFSLIAIGEMTVHTGTAGVLIALEPVFVVIWIVVLGRSIRLLNPVAVFGAAIGLVGVWFLVGSPGGGPGSLFLVAAALWYGLGAVLIERWFPSVPSVHLAAAMLAAAAPILVVGTAVFDLPGRVTPTGLAAMVALGAFCTAGSFVTFFALIARIGAQRAALAAYVAPVIAFVAGVSLRGEVVTPATVAGSVLVLISAWAGLRSGRTRPAGLVAEADGTGAGSMGIEPTETESTGRAAASGSAAGPRGPADEAGRPEVPAPPAPEARKPEESQGPAMEVGKSEVSKGPAPEAGRPGEPMGQAMETRRPGASAGGRGSAAAPRSGPGGAGREIAGVGGSAGGVGRPIGDPCRGVGGVGVEAGGSPVPPVTDGEDAR